MIDGDQKVLKGRVDMFLSHLLEEAHHEIVLLLLEAAVFVEEL
jgi:hypothetical protein